MNVIGRGGFGKVWKVFDKKFQKYYALKEISKVKVIDKKSINTIKYERELLCHLSHPLIINLHYSFQDDDNLYFVLDLLTGGDLRYQLGRHPRRYYSESQTKFFVACIVESLIYIHSKNIIHRDIKPENLIFDDKGYLHITDFGIAKYSNNKNLNETSGTPGYMAPEVMRGLNQTGSVDYFAVGVITYELMLGRRPYTGKNRKEIKEQMMMKQIFLDNDSIPMGWSQEAADFINRLLIRNDTNRLGYYNDLEIKKHPWLKDINFNDLLEGKIRAPFIPRKNQDNYDKKYCQEIEEIGIETNMRYENYKNNERYQYVFEGFTYYNVDETQLMSYHEIYRKPSVKYVKSSSSINNSNNYAINKSKTINLDYDYKRRINQNLSQNPIPSANNVSMRTIHYSNGNEITTNKIINPILRQNRSYAYIDNSKYILKNPDDLYIMASPSRRGRITINNDDSNIDNHFRKYANHSFVETNYSKGKTIRRSYSSSNLYNNNYVNVFNLLVNNVNNINNNNILVNNNMKNKENYPQTSRQNVPIGYNIANKSKIPIDKRNSSNIKNNNYIINSYNNRSNQERSKNSSFSYNDKEKILYSGLKNNDTNNSFRFSSNCSYKKNNLNNIFNIEPSEAERKSYLIPDKYKNLRRNHSYSYVCYFKNDIPHNSIKKIIPVNSNDKANSYKNENIQINSYSNNKNNINYNTINNIQYINKRKSSNSFIYIDKYQKEKENVVNHKNEKISNPESTHHSKLVNNKDCQKQKYVIMEENHLNKRAPPPILLNNNYNIIEINNNKNDEKIEENKIINVPQSPKLKEKNVTYKKIPIPFPLSHNIKRKKLVLENDNEKTLNIKLNTSNKNKGKILLKNKDYKSYYPINDKENIIINNSNSTFAQTIELNKYDNKIFLDKQKLEFNNFEITNQKPKTSIIPMKIIEKNLFGYQYLNNFDKYKKIKNNHDNYRNINFNKKVIHPNIIKKKINNKYHTIESRENQIKNINSFQENNNDIYYQNI